ncbi:MAG TPA: 2-C-methyl-D-erythritol 2,4-cyclodiphosphate synthase [Bacteroidales bacterium]|nr:2-C-methyl-D-erythritol 2,4-cyclodiphosphate synthase [Bacteroidales bacterium]HQH40440.1 2-C-methyl-D-erythritol 2,4-cyclodiphosphate synthase [Bacteroidales bacterium]HQK38030.1 2-C-methyl-D-erythritol 2,4-cyclodiphosphate synthase [Bacteroidales bacterium]
MRIGFGYDIHRLKEGIPLVLGGVNIPSDRGCVAHSDGDVLLHALMDAMLGGAGLRDIGWHFPDSSDEYKGIDSRKLLVRVNNIISEAGFRVGNIDTTILLEKPKIKDLIPQMQQVLSSLLDIAPARIGIKAGTNEGVGEIGQGQAIAAWAVVLLEEK